MLDKAEKYLANDVMKAKLYLVFGMVLLLVSLFVCDSLAKAAFFDHNATETVETVVEDYNDGTLQVTGRVEGKVHPITGVTDFVDQITVTNLTDNQIIKFNNISINMNDEFESSDIKNWTVKNTSETLFSGGKDSQYIPDFNIDSGASKTFSVATTLSGADAGKLANATPFNFIYDYETIDNEYKVNYVVSVYGIGQDEVNGGSEVSGLTFGPAVGEDVSCLDVDGHEHHSAGKHCIHEDSWEEIIANCEAGNWDLYSECIDYGCTKNIELKLNDTIKGGDSYKDKTASVLYHAINSSYEKWNNTYDRSSTNPEQANWATSRIRATLNGKTGSESTWAGTGLLDSTNCLLSCFPESLQEAIKAKYYKVPTNWSTSYDTSYQITDSTDVEDKLWLMNAEEVFGTSVQSSYLAQWEWGKDQYQRNASRAVTTSNYGINKGFSERRDGTSRWLRDPTRFDFYSAGFVGGSGILTYYEVGNSGGLSPCFCLGAQEKSKHLSDYSWSELKEISNDISENGTSSEYYDEFVGYAERGEYKVAEYGDGEHIAFRIVDILHDKLDVSGTKKAGLTFMACNSINTPYQWNSTTNNLNWRDSSLRATLQSDIYNGLESDLKNNIANIMKDSIVGRRSGHFDQTLEINQESLYLPSAAELGYNSGGYLPTNEEIPFTYKQNDCYQDTGWTRLSTGPFFTNITYWGFQWLQEHKSEYTSYSDAWSALPAEGKVQGSTDASSLWERSINKGSSVHVGMLGYDGSSNFGSGATNFYPVAFCFSLGDTPEPTSTLNYMVNIYGIGQDTVDGGAHTAGLTFGPAVGETADCLHVDGHEEHGKSHGGHCICEDSWNTIIKNCNEGHADYYSACLDYHCAKNVPITLNSTIGTQPASDTLASVLSDSIKSTYRKWNDNYSDSDSNSVNWSTSRIRATLNGANGEESTYAGTELLDSTNCLLSCFPINLQVAIKPKYYQVPVTWQTSRYTTPPYKIDTSTDVEDKLWLMNAEEVWGTSVQTWDHGRIWEWGKAQYKRNLDSGITNASSSTLNWGYKENLSMCMRTLRCPDKSCFSSIAFVHAQGGLGACPVNLEQFGFSPCFCLGTSGNVNENNLVSLGLGNNFYNDVSAMDNGKLIEDNGSVVKESDGSKEQVNETLVANQVTVEEEGSKGNGAVGDAPMLSDVGADAATGGVSALAVAGLAIGAFRRRLRGRHVKVK